MVLNYPSHFSIKGPKEKKKIQKILSKYAIIEHRPGISNNCMTSFSGVQDHSH